MTSTHPIFYEVCISEGGRTYRSHPIRGYVEASAEADLIPGAWLEPAS